jgi:aminoglycoside phosphotransferase (APT) family kinase protein
MPIDIPDVERAIRPHLPSIGPIAITPISTGKFNTSFFITGNDISWVIRIAPPHDSVFIFYEHDIMRQEPGIHAQLLEQTSVPVPHIIVYDDSLTQIDRDFVIMERLDGHPISDVSCDYNKVLNQVGDILAQTHLQEAEANGYIGEHRPMEPQARWVDAFHIMWNRLIDGVVEVGHYDEAESTRFRSLLDRHIRLFDRDIPSSLLHMDVWAENILVDDNSTVTGLIDWDRACRAILRSSTPSPTTAEYPNQHSGKVTEKRGISRPMPVFARYSTCSTSSRNTSSSGRAVATIQPELTNTNGRFSTFFTDQTSRRRLPQTGFCLIP